MGFHFDRARTSAKHHDAALVSLLARHSELETVDPREAPMTARISNQTEAAKGDVPVEQFHVHLFTVLPHRDQRPFAYAMGMPQPGASGEQHKKDEQVTESHHACARLLRTHANRVMVETSINSPAKRHAPNARPTPSFHPSFHVRCRRTA